MNKKKICLLDVDEVMLDHIGGLRKFVQKHYDIHPIGEPTSYDLSEWMNVDRTTVQEIMKHFNERSYEFGMLEVLDSEAPDYLRLMKGNFKGVKWGAVTKSGTGGHGDVLRRVNLEYRFPNVLDEIHIVEMYESKKAVLYKLMQKYDVQFLVDDHIDNIMAAQSLGIPGIMLKASHNVRFENMNNDFEYVTNWYQLQRAMTYRLMK